MGEPEFMDKSQTHVEQKKKGMKRYLCYDPIYIKYNPA